MFILPRCNVDLFLRGIFMAYRKFGTRKPVALNGFEKFLAPPNWDTWITRSSPSKHSFPVEDSNPNSCAWKFAIFAAFLLVLWKGKGEFYWKMLQRQIQRIHQDSAGSAGTAGCLYLFHQLPVVPTSPPRIWRLVWLCCMCWVHTWWKNKATEPRV